MKTFILDVPHDASVTVEAGKIVIGVNDPNPDAPLSDVLTLHCVSGSPEEGNEANTLRKENKSMRLGKKVAGPIMVYVVPESDKHRADEFIERARARSLSLRTARELEIDALRKQYPLFPAELALKVNHRYGLLEISEGNFAWRNGKQVPNSTEINLIAYTYCEDKVLRCNTAWGGMHESRVKHGMVLFEL